MDSKNPLTKIMNFLITIILISVAWEAPNIPQLACPIVAYRVYDCIEDLCHPEDCQIMAEVEAGKLMATFQIDDYFTHVITVRSVGDCGLESWPSNPVFYDPHVYTRRMSPLNLHSL